MKKVNKQIKKLKKRIIEIEKKLFESDLTKAMQYAVDSSNRDIPFDGKTSLIPPTSFEELNFQIISENDTGDVYIKIIGFNSSYESESYAHYLAKCLPLLLYKSDIIQ
jgi:hypothetical protein